jgi:DNA ligase (NAD+)
MPSVQDIVTKLRAASAAYYGGGDELMSDTAFDALRDELKSLEPDHPFFSEVGAPEHRDKVALLMHMGSQNKAKDVAEFKEWYDKHGQPEVLISDKLDGSSMEVVYEGGALVRVATRGDGKTGMDITRNGRLWSGLPLTVSVHGRLIVRGEAQLSVALWQEHFPDKANPRNAGNGIVVADVEQERNRHIAFHAFDLVHPDRSFSRQSEKFVALTDLGFQVSRHVLAADWDAVQAVRTRYEQDRAELPFEIDGMVVAIDDLAVQEELGYSDGGTRPKGQIAWKFDTDKAETEVLDITNSIGHTGKIIPTATLAPVRLAGTTVTHCLLNNFDYIAEMNINIGDLVEVEKGGDIIPHINRVIEKRSEGPFPPPSDWKGYPLVKDGTAWKVVDEDCPDLTYQRIRNWIKKTGIKQLGETALMAMMDAGLVRDIADLYSLDEEAVAALEVGNGVIGTNAGKIIAEVAKTTNMPLATFIGSLSIKHLGRARAELLGFHSIDEYFETPLVGKPISDVGTYSAEIAEEVQASLEKRRDIIESLRPFITFEAPKAVVADGALSGKTFCFSGVRLKGEVKERFEAQGGMDLGKVNKDLDYLVVKDPTSTSSKVKKAQGLGIPVIDLDEFEALLD